MGFIQTILALLVTLGILVTIHEWGHYWVARRCGVKVLRFSVGFGKPIWMRTAKNGTEFAIAAIPLGGYVRMLDEREGPVPDQLKSQAFNNKPVLQRIAVVAAGPLVNLLFAVLAYWFLFVVGVTVVKPVVGSVSPGSIAEMSGVPLGAEIVEIDGRKVGSWEEINLALAARVGESGSITLRAGQPESGLLRSYQAPLDRWDVDLENESPLRALGLMPWQPDVEPRIGQLVPEGAASQSGLMSGDLVLSIDGEPTSTWIELVETVQGSAAKELQMIVDRDGRTLVLEVTPGLRPGDDSGQGYIGAGVVVPQWPESMQRDLSQDPVSALFSAVDKTGQMIGLTLDSIKKMILGAISVKNLSGPITIAKVAGDSASSGLESFISFLAYLSISLGILNLLPIPMLDGGHLVYYFVELIRGRPVSEKTQAFGMRIGMALLFSLMALAMFNDLARL